MPRYIDAEAFENDILERHCEQCKRENKGFCLPICGYWHMLEVCGYWHMLEGVRAAPTADVQKVKRAHWIIARVYWNGGSDIAEVYCSRCKNNPSLKKPDCILPNYCDKCGSYMARNKDDLEKEKDDAEIH